MDAVARIAEMLKDASPHKRIAAAVVLGELKIKDGKVIANLCELARDPIDAYASAAADALGQIGSVRALPALLDALDRGGEVGRAASRAITALGADALPAIRERLGNAAPSVRATLSQLLPAVGGRDSFALTLDGLYGQPWDAANRVALAVRQELKSASPADRKAMRAAAEKFLGLKPTRASEVALRAGLKILGFLDLPETAEVLLRYLGGRHPPPVRVEAATALRFALSAGPSKRAVRRLMELLADADPLVVRAARDTLTTLPIGAEQAGELAELTAAKDLEVARWAIARLGALGAKPAAMALLDVAIRGDRARAQAAAVALGSLPGGEKFLVDALVRTKSEAAALVVAEALHPLVKKLGRPAINRLRAAGAAALAAGAGLGRRKLEPVRDVDPTGWATVLRARALALGRRQPERAAEIYGILGRSSHGSPEDRYALARLLLVRSPLSPLPAARAQDPSLDEIARLADDGFAVARTLAKDTSLSDAARYYVGFHFAERPSPEARAVGVALLEALADKGAKSKFAKAAKNKLALLD